MKARNLGVTLIGTAVIAALSVGCDADDDRSGASRDGGSSTVTVEGAVDDDFEGHATFTDASLELGQFSMGLTDNRTFGIDLTLRVDDNAPPPEGTYRIGEMLAADTFHATFRKFEDGSFMNATEFSTNADAGTLVITSSSDNTVEGTFTFEATDPSDGAQIRVTDGRFRAVQVRGGM